MTTVDSMQTAAMLVAQDMGYLFTSPIFLKAQMAELAPNIVYCMARGIPDSRKIYHSDTYKEEMISQFLKLLRVVMFKDQPGMFPLDG